MLHTLRDTLQAYRQWAQAEAGLWRRRTRAAGGPPHLLLIAWSLPPDVSPGTFRPASLLRHAAEFGWRATGLAGPVRKPEAAGDAAWNELAPHAPILRCGVPALRPSWSGFTLRTQIDGGFLNALALYGTAVEQLRDDPPDVVLASGPPHAAAVAGLLIARRAAAPLVIDYRDEWSECPFEFVEKHPLDRWWERRCLRHASRVVFTTESQRSHQLAVFPALAPARAVTIPNGWESADGVPRPACAAPRESVVLAFVGTLAPHSSAREFLRTLAALLVEHAALATRVRLRIVGRVTDDEADLIARFPSRHVIEVVGLLPKAQADACMREADALLIFASPAMARYRPGKLYEYLAARRPVLVFGHRGEASAVVEALQAGAFVAEGDVAGLARFIEALPKGEATGAGGTLDDWLEQHSRRNLAGRMFDLLKEARGA